MNRLNQCELGQFLSVCLKAAVQLPSLSPAGNSDCMMQEG